MHRHLQHDPPRGESEAETVDGRRGPATRTRDPSPPPPEPHRGTRNEPAHVAHVLAAVARARGVAVDACAALTTANARRILRLR